MQLLWAVDTYLLKNVGYEIENGTNSSQEFDWISTLQFKQMMTISQFVILQGFSLSDYGVFKVSDLS